MRFRLFAILGILAALSAPATAATTIADPVKFVTGLYAKMAAATPASSYVAPEDIYTPRLAALFALDTKEAGGEVGRMDFDFWSNAQDWQLGAVKVSGVPVEGAKDREVVIARFKNFGKPQEIHFYFEKTAAGWKLDDARSLMGEQWTLSLILKYGWDGKD
jgi:hypothetical protein